MTAAREWVSAALAAAVGVGLGVGGYDGAVVAGRAGLGAGLVVEVALRSAGLGMALALLPALLLAGLLALSAWPRTPQEAVLAVWARRSAGLVVGGTVGAGAYGALVFAAGLALADAIRTDALRLTAVSLAAAAALPVAWLVGAAAARSVSSWPLRAALAVPSAALLAGVALAAGRAPALALLGPDALGGPAAALAGGLVALAIVLVRARPRPVAALALVLGAAFALPMGDEARTALVFDAPCAAALGALLPADAAARGAASAAPPTFALTPHARLRKRWPIVLVTIDSLRPDHVGAYGGRRPTTPHLDALAHRGLVFERAYATGSSTRFSIPSFMTGRFMSQLAMKGRAILPENTTFAEVLGRAGWHTVGLMGPTERGTGPGVGQGFATFRHSRDLRGAHIDRGLVDEALALLAAAPRGKPLLLWVHLYDPHTPFVAEDDAPPWGQAEVDRYDREVWSTDRQLGRLLGAVDERFGPQGAVVIVSADHGEAFGEHGKVGHSAQLYEELVRVPLVVRVPGGATGRTPMLASLLDVFPTLLDLTGVRHEAVLEGRSLLPVLSGGPPDEGRMVFEELRFGQAEQHGQTAVHQGRHHLIVDAASGAGVLYDVARDRREARPLPQTGRTAPVAARLRAAVLGLRARLDADFRAASAADEPAPGDEHE